MSGLPQSPKVPAVFPPQSITLTSRGRPVRIHLLSTGRIADKTRMRSPRFRGPAALLDILLDHRFTEWLPVWIAVIEHPRGIFLIDTGQSASITDPGYFRPAGLVARWFDTTQFRFDMSGDQQINRQLARVNIPKPTAILLTHLHFDHTGGLPQFPDVPVLLNRLEWEHPHGAFFPAELKPILLDPDRPLSPFQHTLDLTGDEDLFLVHTPGHTYGHSSVLLRTDSAHLFFAADVCYNQEQLLQDRLPANLTRRRLARETYANVKAYARLHPLIFLPSHDVEAAQRLHALSPLPSAD